MGVSGGVYTSGVRAPLKHQTLCVTSFDIRLEIFNRFQLSIANWCPQQSMIQSALFYRANCGVHENIKFRDHWLIIAKFINAKFYELILAENQVCSVSVVKQLFSSSQSSTGADIVSS